MTESVIRWNMLNDPIVIIARRWRNWWLTQKSNFDFPMAQFFLNTTSYPTHGITSSKSMWIADEIVWMFKEHLQMRAIEIRNVVLHNQKLLTRSSMLQWWMSRMHIHWHNYAIIPAITRWLFFIPSYDQTHIQKFLRVIASGTVVQ